MSDNMGYIGTYTTFFWITVNGVTYEEHCKLDEAAKALKQMAASN